MDTLSQTAEDYSNQLQHLLSNAAQKEQEEKIENFFREYLGVLTDILEIFRKTLDTTERLLEEGSVTPDELWSNRNFRLVEEHPIISQPDFGVPDLRQRLETLDEADKLLALLDQIEKTRQTAILCNHETDEFILTAWRKEHPYFSSSGTLKSDIQSERLRDFKALDRR